MKKKRLLWILSVVLVAELLAAVGILYYIGATENAGTKGGLKAGGSRQVMALAARMEREAGRQASGEGEAGEEAEAADDTEAVGNGLIVAIDPGHQGSHIDMSEQEENGPGSGEMKAKEGRPAPIRDFRNIS